MAIKYAYLNVQKQPQTMGEKLHESVSVVSVFSLEVCGVARSCGTGGGISTRHPLPTGRVGVTWSLLLPRPSGGMDPPLENFVKVRPL